MKRFAGLLLVGLLGMIGSQLAAQEMALAERGPRFLLASANGKAKPVEIEAGSNVLLRQVVALNLEHPTVGGLLDEISRQTGLTFFYGQDAVSPDRPVTLRADSITVATALIGILMDARVDVMLMRGRQVALVKRRPRPAPAQEGSIVGRVTDRATDSPLGGAAVAVEETRYSATTDSDGRYRIAGVEAGTYTARARYIGYAPLSVSVTVAESGEATADFALARSVQRLDEVVTIGTLVPTEVKALPTPITVIRAEEIEAQRVQRVDQLVRGQVPGMIAFDNSTYDYSTSLFVRGSNTLVGDQETIKTLIDNVEVANSYYLGAIDPHSIERIEITRGPQASTIYGSDASGGVMQIFTKKGMASDRPRLSGSLGLGAIANEYGTQTALRPDLAGSVFGGGNQFTYNVGGSYRRTGEWLPDYYDRTGSVSGGASLTQGGLTANVSARYAAKTFSFASDPALRATGFVFFSRPHNEINQLKQQTYGLSLRYAIGGGWSHSLTLGHDRSVYGYRNTAPRLTTPADTLVSVYSNDLAKASIGYNTTLNAQLGASLRATITGGVDHDRASRTNTSSFAATRSTGSIDGNPSVLLQSFGNTGYFGQVVFGFRDVVFLTGGVRAETNDNFGPDVGTVVSPRLGLSWVLPLVGTIRGKVRLSYGEATRAPLSSQREAVQYSYLVQLENRSLKPELQHGSDGGVDLFFGQRASIGITYYRQTALDLIENVLLDDTTPLPTWQYQNAGEVANSGWELEGRVTFTGIQVVGTFSPTTSRVKALVPGYGGNLRVGDRALYVPRHSAGATVTVTPFQRTSLSAQMTHVGSWVGLDFLSLYRSLSGADPARESFRDYWMVYPAFTKFKVSVEQTLNEYVSGFAVIDNVTNNLARERYNFLSQTGRIVTLGARFSY